MADTVYGPRKINIVGTAFQAEATDDSGLRDITYGQASIPAALSTTVDTGLGTVDAIFLQTQASTVAWPTGDFPGQAGSAISVVGQAAGSVFWKAIGTRA